MKFTLNGSNYRVLWQHQYHVIHVDTGVGNPPEDDIRIPYATICTLVKDNSPSNSEILINAISKTYYKDNFSKLKGRRVSFTKVLNGYFTRFGRTEIWKQILSNPEYKRLICRQ